MNRLLCFFRGHDNHFFLLKNNFVSFFFFFFATKLREKSSLAVLSIQIRQYFDFFFQDSLGNGT